MSRKKRDNIKQVIDSYISKITIFPVKFLVQFNFFPSINLEPEEIEKNCPLNECVADTQEQFSLFDSSKNAVDNGGEGKVQTSKEKLRYLRVWTERSKGNTTEFQLADRILENTR